VYEHLIVTFTMQSSASLCVFTCTAPGALAQETLFDRATDRTEANDVSGDPKYASTLAELRIRMAYFQSLAAPMETETPLLSKAFNEAGGMVPYMNDYLSPPIKPTVTRPTTVSSAPALVFVLAGDLGFNDVNFHDGSTWIDFATPRMDALASNRAVLLNHNAGWICIPTRGALLAGRYLLTGRYPNRLGMGDTPPPTGLSGNLPLAESTLAHELQMLGYRIAMVGKWSLGFETWGYYPTYRGFGSFYGFVSGGIGYYSKENDGGFYDLHDQKVLVRNPSDKSMHLTMLCKRT
jgi:hypothetical protein